MLKNQEEKPDSKPEDRGPTPPEGGRVRHVQPRRTPATPHSVGQRRTRDDEIKAR